MDKLQRILTEITQLTNTIKADHPQLYKFLDEDPVTIPTKDHPDITLKVMKDYLDSLKQILKHSLDSTKK
ncbi:hypothetical protein HCG49_04330 [Arenibacter sp. 6A1]|uniref:hypothetical protein n=1 Tax=Arenibacter sp. 6A1 TaxID=2720391 RepID=UPI00144676BE|nr:hypothetical protein [Arenibacter sp. 6A1]NKI25785.1 hypothetical protein [Arenibacter sp. 6A1]